FVYRLSELPSWKLNLYYLYGFFFSSRRRHTRSKRDWSSDVCSSDLARFIGVLVFPAGAVLGHTPDTKDLIEDMGTFRPTFILSVPRVFEKVYNSAEQKAAADGKLKIFRMAAATAVEYSRALDEGKPGIGLRLRHALFSKLVYSKLHKTLGNQVTHAISGGAPLGERLGHFFRGIGLVILEG